MSAARNTPLPTAGSRLTRQQLRESASDTILNAAGLLRDVWDDFKSSDRYFKYKAWVLGCWLTLTLLSVAVAWPDNTFGQNSFGARLVVAGDPRAPIYMIKNDSDQPWHDVEVRVNGEYRSTASQVDAQREITLSPVVLYNSAGARAPADLQINQIIVQIGDDPVSLLEHGQLK